VRVGVLRHAQTTCRYSDKANQTLPPCKGAVPGSDATSSPTQRDRHILEIEERGRMHWQKPLAITDARKSRRLSGVTNASSATLSSHALTIAAKRKWRLPSKRSIVCVSSVRRSSFASHDHEAKGRMPSPARLHATRLRALSAIATTSRVPPIRCPPWSPAHKVRARAPCRASPVRRACV
jgi:hypothetical protein